MEILYINQYASSPYHGKELRSYYLAKEWISKGNRVTILACSFSHLRTNNIEMQSNWYQEEIIDNIKYIWCNTPHYKKNTFMHFINVIFFVTRVKKLFKKVLVNNKYDLVIASSIHPLDCKVAKKIALHNSCKFIFEVHEIWSLIPVTLGKFSRFNPFIMCCDYYEDFAFKNADYVVSLFAHAKDYFMRKGMLANKFLYIPNGFNINNYINKKELLDNIVVDKINAIKGNYKFCIAYVGNLSKQNALEYPILAAKLVQNSSIAFIIVGNGEEKENLQKICKAKNVNNVFFIDVVKQSQVLQLLEMVNATYLGWRKLLIYRYGIAANKLINYMLAKKPIIHSITYGNNILKEANCGITIESESVEQIARGFDRLSKMNKKELAKLGNNGYEYAMNNYDYKVLANKFIESTTNIENNLSYKLSPSAI